ncbi:MAG: hypothetical protein Q7V56_00645 [Gammaproteobacteria bacterium]|nr:hypothetical protein [Gammaproteobacteria bacterium]
MKLLKVTILLSVLVMCNLHAAAEVTQRDMQVTARALGFLTKPFTGDTLMGILYDPQNARSLKEAEEIQTMLGSGLQSGGLTLRAQLVPLDQLGSASVDLFFLTGYLGDSADLLRASLATRKIPCVSTDIEQVRSGRCVMGIVSAPRVEILVNRKAAEETGTSFASMFRMMILEI